jgi:hypothetical protein
LGKDKVVIERAFGASHTGQVPCRLREGEEGRKKEGREKGGKGRKGRRKMHWNKRTRRKHVGGRQ